MPDKKMDLLYQRSETIQEIVSSKPGFLVEWGNFFFLSVFVLLAAGCWFIKYPDVLYASAKLSSINTPKPVVTMIGGKLVELKFHENKYVEKGEILGHIESPANHEDVVNLDILLDSIQHLPDLRNIYKTQVHFANMNFELGDLQTSFQTFLRSLVNYSNYIGDGFYINRKAILLQDQIYLKELERNLREQQELYKQDLAIWERLYEPNEMLSRNSVIIDFANDQSKIINKKLMLPQIRAAIAINKSQQLQKESDILELENTISQQNLFFRQAVNTFKSQIEEWKKKYILIAPISGRVRLASFIQENQQLTANQTICYLDPENIEYFAEIVIPQSNLGKASHGQQVLLKLQSYPFLEYGTIVGRIDFISNVPSNDGYLARVSLSNGLVTTYNKQVQYRDGLKASAEIITKQMRLMDRIYYEVFGRVVN